MTLFRKLFGSIDTSHKSKDEVSDFGESHDPKVSSLEREILDMEMIEAAREVLGDKFKTIVNYYLEDSEGYIEQILKGAAQGDGQAVISPAHTLKSSSFELGVVEVHKLAAAMEKEARQSLDANGTFENLKERATIIKAAFDRVRPELETIALV